VNDTENTTVAYVVSTMLICHLYCGVVKTKKFDSIQSLTVFFFQSGDLLYDPNNR
jgi:hypothetical protein